MGAAVPQVDVWAPFVWIVVLQAEVVGAVAVQRKAVVVAAA
jgi:hypothetical protein